VTNAIFYLSSVVAREISNTYGMGICFDFEHKHYYFWGKTLCKGETTWQKPALQCLTRIITSI
jgi:hypothetical protein